MSSEQSQSIKSRYGAAIRNLLFVTLTIGMAYVVTVSIGIEGLRNLAASIGIWGAFAVVLLKATTIIVIPLGGGPIYVIAGAAYGFWKGLLLTAVGDTIGFTIAFYLSRFFGRSILDFFVPISQTQQLERILEKSSTISALLKARIAFLSFPELFAYLAGLTSVSFPIFFLIQWGIHAPLSVILVFFGDAILRLMENPLYFIVGSVVISLTALIGGWWFHRDVIREA
ncbi:hypothetical protein A2841_01050 [Candidatus Kaiserbacteria bacterium RIFCSPHIGHO2_01_FULL_48_10]|uniref:TVP38/TMEM64 family membrane protein n=1 Tax=Candidatus Kaiserbacteria bacterium RIFCSPHIGHO2_01_FULL_48_10 TaxID=1798476 RepID=A0A1F6C4E7_9BACT|nr:MAG: hypothetical protein A2841_01050 [Candidatus Kaiserbacteria bacterium RIFCSPHIGHO2_01_FULL_48_10]